MEASLRAVLVYTFLFVIFRVSGKRSLGQVTTFDFVLLLIIAETTQQALLGDDFSVTNCFVLIGTLFGIDLGLARLKRLFPRLDKWIEGQPLVIVAEGKPIYRYMEHAGVGEDDVLRAARELHGLSRMDQIQFAVLERNGGITIIPADPDRS
ncbi:DUF421 domain-containing protein [Haloferula sargassicola]|uniref:UPF0702 transmembrane protein YetF n=1 Tax=Haloferula sargassicola TaxID=490096 RepID=A0ABP9URU0_9BACT